ASALLMLRYRGLSPPLSVLTSFSGSGFALGGALGALTLFIAIPLAVSTTLRVVPVLSIASAACPTLSAFAPAFTTVAVVCSAVPTSPASTVLPSPCATPMRRVTPVDTATLCNTSSACSPKPLCKRGVSADSGALAYCVVTSTPTAAAAPASQANSPSRSTCTNGLLLA